LVKDIYPGANSSNPSNIFINGSTMYLVANNGTAGEELWKSDGTTAGTILVKDIAPGGVSGIYPYTFWGAVGSSIFIQADGGGTGDELWKTDGTTAGTVLVKDIAPGASSGVGGVQYSAVVGSTFFFTADNGINGVELWKSDGTSAGTILVKDINTGTASSSPKNFCVVGSTLYFTATTSANGEELWKSDGTTAGTVMLKDINVGSASSSALYFTILGSNIYFSANNGINGNELWKSDGSSAGTVMVSDIYTGSGNGDPEGFTIFSGQLFFSATTSAGGTELWKSNGTTSGTVLVKDIETGTGSSFPSSFTVAGSLLYFPARTSATGYELWKSDGTTGGTVLVRDINAGVNSSGISNLSYINGTLYFSAGQSIVGQYYGDEPWKTDGTFAGTVMIDDMQPYDYSSFPSAFLGLNSTVLFHGSTPSAGRELFKITTGHIKRAHFVAQDTFILAGSATNFNTDFFDQTPNDPTSWSWTFTGGTPSTSNLQHPVNIAYTTPGCYPVTLTTGFASGTGTTTRTCYIQVADINTYYCVPHTSSGTTNGKFISKVTLGSINNSSGSASGPDFTHYTSPTTTLNQSTQYKIYIQGGFVYQGGIYPRYYAYIDYNRDGLFDNTEYLGSSIARGSWPSVATDTITFTVPATTITGTTRLRIQLDEATSGSFADDPCDIDDVMEGETEDYNIVLSSGAGSAPVANFSANNTTPTVGSPVNFTDLSTNNPTAWSWSFTGGSPSTSTTQNPTGITYSAPGCYQVTLTASNSAGSDAEVKTCYINVTSSGGGAPVANFSASSTSISSGGSTNFTDLSTNSPTSWSWSFTGGTPATSTVQNPTGITYSTPGCYQVTLTATNASGSDQEIKTCYINVTSGTGSYCSITSSTYGTTEGDYIDGVALGTINNQNTGSATGPFYVNYTSMSTNLIKSTNYTLNIKSGNWPAGYPDYYAAWIDFNHDYDFSDAGEKIGEFLSTASNTVQSLTFTVPSTAVTAITRMRVRGVWNSTAGIDPCLAYAYGETEDYSVNIVPAGGGSAPVANFSASSTSISAGSSINFTDLSTNSPTSWSWTFTGATTSSSTSQNPTGITYLAAGCYQVVLTATNANGSDSETKTCYINVTTGSTSNSCDTLQNFNNSNTLVLYTNTSGGYVAGHNSFGDLAKADIFSGYTPGHRIKGAYIAFGKAKYSSTTKTINVRVWDDNGTSGAPNTVLATKTVTIASIAPDVTAGNYTYVQFTTPVVVTGPFYLGIEYAYAAGDTVAIYSNSDGETTPGTAWEKFSDGTWHPFSDATQTWGLDLSLAIRPLLCSISTGTEDLISDVKFEIYPNPNTGQFILETNYLQSVNYSIVNSLGEEVSFGEMGGSNKIVINMENLPNGIYFVLLKYESQTVSKKVLIQH
jgi:ELWxxDGT repeat protein